MNHLRQAFINKVVADLNILSGEAFERFSRHILELDLSEKVLHKGQNLYAKPVKSTADFADDQYEIIGQCGTDENYWDTFKKPLHDVKRAIELHSTAQTIYVFSNRYAGTARIGNFVKAVKLKKEWKDLTVKAVDSERIAEIIYDKILASSVVDEVFSYLPSAKELYKILPNTSGLPQHKNLYYEREVEKELIEKLTYQECVQVHGISGIGKTELTLNVAKKLFNNYDTVVWIDGDLVENKRIDFNAVRITRLDTLINLSTILENYKALIIFDNVNENVGELVSQFKANNKNFSKCLISSVAPSLPPENRLQVQGLEDSLCKKILEEADKNPTPKEIDTLVEYTGAHPLILRVITAAISNEAFSFQEIIEELQNVHAMFDMEKNVKIAQRIIGKLTSSLKTELAVLKQLGSRKIIQAFLLLAIGKIQCGNLEAFSIIRKNDAKYFDVHQILLDSINAEINVSTEQKEQFENSIIDFLKKHTERKDVAFFAFIFNHGRLLEAIKGNTTKKELKKLILYSQIQGVDVKSRHLINSIIAEIQPLIEDTNNYLDILLSIEIREVELANLPKKSDNYKQKSDDGINYIKAKLEKVKDDAIKAHLFHHLGKLYMWRQEYREALQAFDQVLNLVPNDAFALLQKARIYNTEENYDEVENVFKIVFALQNPPLSVILSLYELLANNDVSGLQEKYIFNNIDAFCDRLVESFDSRFDQPYRIMKKLGGTLGYLAPEYFGVIIKNLPKPSYVNLNDNLKLDYASIQVAFYSYLKHNSEIAAPIFNIEKEKDTCLSLAKEYFSHATNNFDRRNFIKILLDAGEFQTAYEIFQAFDEQNNPFQQQQLCKILLGLNKLPEALTAIIIGIDNYLGDKEYHMAAFLNDKAEVLYAMKDSSCITTLKQAIEKQTTLKTIELWQIKLKTWESQLS